MGLQGSQHLSIAISYDAVAASAQQPNIAHVLLIMLHKQTVWVAVDLSLFVAGLPRQGMTGEGSQLHGPYQA